MAGPVDHHDANPPPVEGPVERERPQFPGDPGEGHWARPVAERLRVYLQAQRGLTPYTVRNYLTDLLPFWRFLDDRGRPGPVDARPAGAADIPALAADGRPAHERRSRQAPGPPTRRAGLRAQERHAQAQRPADPLRLAEAAGRHPERPHGAPLDGPHPAPPAELPRRGGGRRAHGDAGAVVARRVARPRGRSRSSTAQGFASASSPGWTCPT